MISVLDNLQRELGNFDLLVLGPGLDLGSTSFFASDPSDRPRAWLSSCILANEYLNWLPAL